MPLTLNVGGWGSGTSAAFPGTAGTNANPSPQGPRTSAAAGFGTTVGGGADVKTHATLSVGLAALVILGWIWWSLPR